MKKLPIVFFVLGVSFLFFSTDFSITGGVIGRSFGIRNYSLFILGICFVFVSFVFVMKKNLEAIIVPTGPTAENNRQRAEGGARKYYEHQYIQNHYNVVIISGRIEGEKGKFIGSNVDKIYRNLRRSGVSKKDIILESNSVDTMENVLYTCEKLNERDIREVTIVTDPPHADRFKMLFERAKKEGLAPKGLEVHTYSEGIKNSSGSFRSKFAYLVDLVRPMKKRRFLK